MLFNSQYCWNFWDLGGLVPFHLALLLQPSSSPFAPCNRSLLAEQKQQPCVSSFTCREATSGLQRSDWSSWIIWLGPSLTPTIWTSIDNTYYCTLSPVFKLEHFNWRHLFCFTCNPYSTSHALVGFFNGKVSAEIRSEPSFGRSLQTSMALTPLVLGLNDWFRLCYSTTSLQLPGMGAGLEWIKIIEVLCGWAWSKRHIMIMIYYTRAVIYDA